MLHKIGYNGVRVANHVAYSLGAMSADHHIRESLVRSFIRDMVWALLAVFNDKYTIADQLRAMADVIDSVPDPVHETQESSPDEDQPQAEEQALKSA